MLWMLVSWGGEFRRLLRHPLLKKGGMFVLLLLCLGSGVHAQKRSLPALARKQADSLARKQVIYNDRVVPFNTLARDFVLKLTGKPSYGGMTPEQVIGGWLLRPEVWQNEPMIYIKTRHSVACFIWRHPMHVWLICSTVRSIACRSSGRGSKTIIRK